MTTSLVRFPVGRAAPAQAPAKKGRLRPGQVLNLRAQRIGKRRTTLTDAQCACALGFIPVAPVGGQEQPDWRV